MYGGLPGVVGVWREWVRNMGESEVPSTRWALLVGSSKCEGHCWAEDWGELGLGGVSFVCCVRRPGMGKENLGPPRARPMVGGCQRLPAGVWRGCCGRGRDSVETVVSTESRELQLGEEKQKATLQGHWGASGSINSYCAALHRAQWQRQGTACAEVAAVHAGAGTGHVRARRVGVRRCAMVHEWRAPWTFPAPGVRRSCS